MTGFYIKKITVTGKNNKHSFVEFNEGLNIVCGPSDTGKSYIFECIDYIFGSDNIPIDESKGYDCVEVVAVTNQGIITAMRKFRTNKVEVTSSDDRVITGKYGFRNGDKLNAGTDLWLKLIGIEDRHMVITNKDFEKKHLTWRFLSHMFLISEGRVIQREPILLPKQRTVNTGSLASLLFMITGEDFASIDSRDAKEIKVAKKAAVADYIRDQLIYFAERKSELGIETEADANANTLQDSVESIIDEISKTEAQITEISWRNKGLIRDIFDLTEQLTECQILHNRYQSLRSQYRSDIQRLTFIVEGGFHQPDTPQSSKCPFCDSAIHALRGQRYITSSKAELHKLKINLQDLEVSEHDIVDEQAEFENRIAELNAEKQATDDLLNSELKPKALSLKKLLAEFRIAMELQGEVKFINNMETSMKSELFKAEMEDAESDSGFNIKDQFSLKILSALDECIENALRACRYEGLGSARLSIGKFDILVNEIDKQNFGKGYRAFLNTVLSFALSVFLTEHGKYAPGLMVVDSPILSLKERGDEKATDSMKAALFKHLRDQQKIRQIIVFENDIPELDYGDAVNIIRFTKDETQGRYGFLDV